MKNFLLLLLSISVFCNFYFAFERRSYIAGGGKGLVYEDTVEYVDTVPFYYPVPKDSVVIRYVTESLPVADVREVDFPIKSDSVRVEIPITQKVYEGNQYKAYVSGYSQSLDSVFVYPSTQVIRIRDEPKRFSFGLSVGYGMTPKGFQPFVGLSATYNLFRF